MLLSCCCVCSYPGEKVYVAFGRVLARSKDQATVLLFGPTLLAAILSSIASGLLSDAMGGRRKRLLYISGGIMAVAGVLFALTRSFAVDLFLGGVFGLGFGAFSVLDWALAADVLPHHEQIAKVHYTHPQHSRSLQHTAIAVVLSVAVSRLVLLLCVAVVCL